MSSTRHAKPGSPFRQERFASSKDYERGLLANLVAHRCELLQSSEDRERIWFLQYLSHQPGGLAKVAGEMFELGHQDFARINAKRKKQRGEVDGWMEVLYEDFTPATIEAYLSEFCLNPSLHPIRSGEETMIDTLLGRYQQKLASLPFTKTGVSNRVFELLNYALEGQCMVLLEGPERTGKSYAAHHWCQMHAGRARYVQVPASSDDISFFRKIAKALGVSSAFSMKGVQMRERIEQVLEASKLMLVLDEAHYCWPQSNRREALPNRVNWILTELVNNGVPVALVSTPQFTTDQKVCEKKTGWASGQFIGRVAHYERLPNDLSRADIEAVARHHLPDGDRDSIEYLVCYAETSRKFLAGIEHAVKRARYEASERSSAKIAFRDIEKAIRGHVLPSDSALSEALQGPFNARHQAAGPRRGEDGRRQTRPVNGIPDRGQLVTS